MKFPQCDLNLSWNQSHSVENSRFVCDSDFTWNQIRRIYKFKKCRFCNIWSTENDVVFGEFRKCNNLWKSLKCVIKNGSFWSFSFAEIGFTENLSNRKILQFSHCAIWSLAEIYFDHFPAKNPWNQNINNSQIL